MKNFTALLLFVTTFTLSAQEFEDVAKLNFKIGSFTTESKYYAFDQGDVVRVEFYESTGKAIQSLNMRLYNGQQVLSKFKPTDFTEEITIQQKGVYEITFENKLGARICNLNIARQNTSGSALPTLVEWRDVVDTIWSTYNEQYVDTVFYEAQSVQPKQHFFLNGMFNLGGQTRTVLPINLPKNTVEWYYVYSCAREEEEINTISDRINLVGELNNLLADSAFLVSGTFSPEAITKPIGSSQCDIYLLEANNVRRFVEDADVIEVKEGSRENFNSGVVRISNTIQPELTLGIRNGDFLHGVHLVIEVAAVTTRTVIKVREKKTYSLETERRPVIVL